MCAYANADRPSYDAQLSHGIAYNAEILSEAVYFVCCDYFGYAQDDRVTKWSRFMKSSSLKFRFKDDNL